jgi:hypothetical protein
MRLRIITILAIAILCLTPTSAWADLAPYGQDFEGLVQPEPAALADDGWVVFANVWGPGWAYWYGYAAVAPNGTPGFSSIAVNQGGSGQGDQQLVTYSDYLNSNHGDGAHIEANVYQEQTIGAADVGTTWRFNFDAKRGDIGGGTTASAFIKTLDPNAGYALTNLIPIDVTSIPDVWNGYSLSIFIDPSLEGQLLQVGFSNMASNWEPSGMFYDNVRFGLQPLDVSLDIKPGGCPNPIHGRSRGVVPAALLGTAELDVNNIDPASLRLEGVAPIRWGYEDVATPFAADLCGCTAAGPDGFFDLTLKFDTQELVGAMASGKGGDLLLTLTGTLLDGTPIEGQDCVIYVGNGAPSTLQGLQSFQGSIDGLETVDPPSSTPGFRGGSGHKPAPRRSRGSE